jgi:excinuclease ABC subunit C
MAFDKSSLQHFPVLPGVYIMKNMDENVIYVGKAINIKQRVRQYFTPGADSRVQIPQLVKNVTTIETIVVNSEKEALLLENTLIKKHKPKYNVFLKDDKSFICLKIQKKHSWPRIQMVRAKSVVGKPNELYFGPFTNAYAARKTLDVLWQLFPLRRCSDQELKRRTRPCLLYQINRCLGPCVNKCTKQEYQEATEKTIDFLQGKDQKVLDELKEKMFEASKKLNFEQAQQYLEKIQLMEKTIEQQKVYKIGAKDQDVWAVYREGPNGVISLLAIRQGKLTSAQHTPFKDSLQTDEELLTAFLLLYYNLDNVLPQTILLPIKLTDQLILEELLNQQYSKITHIVVPQKGEKKHLIEMAQTNALSEFSKKEKEEDLVEQQLLELKETCHLNNFPAHIECIDISHLFSTQMVGSSIAFRQGKPYKKGYRNYLIKETDRGDDYGAMEEVLKRRLKRGQQENNLPDLIILDGGKGQLNIGKKVIKELNLINIDLISLVKDHGRHDKGMALDNVCLVDQKDPLSLKDQPQLLFLLQRIRDEAHRFALELQKKQRKKTLTKSSLEDIPGIGPTKTKSLFKKFKSLKNLQQASLKEIQETPGITKKDVQELLKWQKRV